MGVEDEQSQIEILSNGFLNTYEGLYSKDPHKRLSSLMQVQSELDEYDFTEPVKEAVMGDLLCGDLFDLGERLVFQFIAGSSDLNHEALSIEDSHGVFDIEGSQRVWDVLLTMKRNEYGVWNGVSVGSGDYARNYELREERLNVYDYFLAAKLFPDDEDELMRFNTAKLVLHNFVIKGTEDQNFWDRLRISQDELEQNEQNLIRLMADHAGLTEDERLEVAQVAVLTTANNNVLYDLNDVGLVYKRLSGLVSVDQLNWDVWKGKETPLLRAVSKLRPLSYPGADESRRKRPEWQQTFSRLAGLSEVMHLEEHLVERMMASVSGKNSENISTDTSLTVMVVEMVRGLVLDDQQRDKMVENLLKQRWDNRWAVLMDVVERVLLRDMAQECGVLDLEEAIEGEGLTRFEVEQMNSAVLKAGAKQYSEKKNEAFRDFLKQYKK